MYEIRKLKNLKISFSRAKISIKRNSITFLFVLCGRKMMFKNRISNPSTITTEEPYLFKPSMIELPAVIRVSPIDFLDTFDRKIIEKI